MIGQYAAIMAVSAFASGLTLFSGFGLGTILLPVFALFFPVELAIAMTAIVHLLNNLFKLALLGKYANRDVLLRFGLPAVLAAYFGAQVLVWFAEQPPLLRYTLGSRELLVTPVKLVIALLIVAFALLELSKRIEALSLPRSALPVGGLLSGFFGGLSGHQGALRSAFLLKCGLSKESFIATGVVIACFVDLSRLFVYSERFLFEGTAQNLSLLAAAVLSAFAGAYFASRKLKKVSMRLVRILVSTMLFVVALGLGSGIF